MKPFPFILIFISGFISTSIAQKIAENQLPAPVVSAVHSQFPTAKDIKWETKKDHFKAAFKIDKREHDVWIDKTGVITKHKEDFPKSELPDAVKKQVAASFKEYTIDDADKMETGGVVVYQLKLKDSKGERKVTFASDGKIQEKNPD